MIISVIGLNHKTAPIEIREKFYLNPIQQDLFLSELKSNPTVSECFILSTCNRTEVYAHLIDDLVSPEIFIRMIMNIKKLKFTPEFKDYFYSYTGTTAIEHLFRVSTGLDSLVIGERQILGQVKTSIDRARVTGMFSKSFNILSNLAIRAGKKAQNETTISAGGSSIGWAAIDKAEKILGTLENKSILMIGAGKMGEVAANQMKNKGFDKFYIMNRTHETAEDLAKDYGGEAVSMYDVKDILNEVDLVLCSASAPHYLIEKSMIIKTMAARANRPLLLIDISMPRNIDPQVSEIPKVSLLQIDDLKEVVDSNLKLRGEAVTQVQTIISNKISEYEQKINTQWADSSSLELEPST